MIASMRSSGPHGSMLQFACMLRRKVEVPKASLNARAHHDVLCTQDRMRTPCFQAGPITRARCPTPSNPCHALPCAQAAQEGVALENYEGAEVVLGGWGRVCVWEGGMFG